MKHLSALALLTILALPAFPADVGISVGVGQPGFYGVLELGNAPTPQLIYPRPVIMQPVPYGVIPPPPIYLRVPPGYARHWRWHCHEFNACGRPVYFVQDGWYNRVYVPFYNHPGEGWREHYQGDGWGREGERGRHGQAGRD